MREIPLTKGAIALIDDEDFEELSQYKWHLTSVGYAARTVLVNGNKKMVLLHRYLKRVSDRTNQVDHINHNRLDNRKSNLRCVTHQQNSTNKALTKNNTSGFKGVSWSKNKQKWHAYIKVGDSRKNLGNFENKIDAAKAYNDAAIKYFGEFAYINSIPETQTEAD